MFIYSNVCKQMTDVELLLVYCQTVLNTAVCKQMIKREKNDLYWIEILDIIWL